MTKKRLSATLVLALSISLSAACANTQTQNSSLSPDGQEPPLTVPEPAQLQPDQMETELQLREGLAALEDKSDTQKEKLTFYKELMARDLFQEADYPALAQLYADLGDPESQRHTLRQAFYLYPRKEYAELLEELIIHRTEAHEAAAEIISALEKALTEQDAAALAALVKSPAWAETFQELPELYAARTQYTAGDLKAQIVSDVFETEILLLTAGGTCLYARISDAGSMISSAVYTDNAYNGQAAVCWFDSEYILYKKYQAVLSNNVCVDSLSVEYDGTTYTGALNDDGTTAEKQPEEISKDSGVVYARQEGGNRYLYQENVSLETFKIDSDFIGLPHISIWE